MALGPGLGSHEQTHKEEEVENEEEVLDEAEATLLGRHLRLDVERPAQGTQTEEVLATGNKQDYGRRRRQTERHKGRGQRKRKFRGGAPPCPLHLVTVSWGPNFLTSSTGHTAVPGGPWNMWVPRT